MLKETEETIVFFVTFLSLVAFQFGVGPGPPGPPPGYAYVDNPVKISKGKNLSKGKSNLSCLGREGRRKLKLGEAGLQICQFLFKRKLSKKISYLNAL